jgi:hypothetical protein
MSNEIWVVKHERYDPPTYVRLYGPFPSGNEADEWASAQDLLDWTVSLRVCRPDELATQLDELKQNRQIRPDGTQL